MLTKDQLSEIRDLQDECEAEDGIRLKLNWDMLERRQDGIKQDFLVYDSNELAGFIGLYGFGNKAELCGMVKPEYRRKGLFSSMLNEAWEEARKQGFHKILLNAPSSSESAKKFLASLQAVYVFSEHQMKWEGGPLTPSDDVTLRLSTDQDIPFETGLEIDCFGFTPIEADMYVNRVKLENREQFFIIEFKGEAVGKVRLAEEKEKESWIYGFAVSPKHQKKGIGRQTLHRILSEETSKGRSVFLEVEAKNLHALKLYESVGFKAYDAQDYYLLR
ncbi:GNAT family N-acetyltransferase [Bacillus sp. FJAT-42376]|uniref:GNAT family N-acetyltransferase n=1 Tax=Bacillus sp. FJAT-42376 TaxID=2014076 RepID=UPI000F4E1F40|nr:GNAT family N-acetyltransferase [Bacillus sp. FJAT-42376]AZB42226.1 GNAT family N-acetyltransferase [Bacillus sp. FJAT-42376]